MANFTDILPEVPTQVIETRGKELITLLLQKLKI